MTNATTALTTEDLQTIVFFVMASVWFFAGLIGMMMKASEKKWIPCFFISGLMSVMTLFSSFGGLNWVALFLLILLLILLLSLFVCYVLKNDWNDEK